MMMDHKTPAGMVMIDLMDENQRLSNRLSFKDSESQYVSLKDSEPTPTPTVLPVIDLTSIIDLSGFTKSTGVVVHPTYHELEEVRNSMKKAMGINGTPAWERGEGGPNDPNAKLSDLAKTRSSSKGFADISGQ